MGAVNVRLLGLDHVVLRVRDLQASLNFYVGVLGCQLERRQDEIGLVQLRAGTALIDLLPLDGKLGRAGGVGPAEQGRNMDHFALRVGAFDHASLRAALEAAGVQVGSYDLRYGADGEGPSLYLRDPDGNGVELKAPALVEAVATPLAQHGALHAELGRALRYGPTYEAHGLTLSSHLPMLLCALARLGATDAQLQQHARRAAARLAPARPLQPGLRMQEWLPSLLTQAVEAMGFHGAIRMAYAMESGHAGEQAAALDAWVTGAGERMSTPQPAAGLGDGAGGSLSLRETLDRVRADPALSMKLRQGTTIMSDLCMAQGLPGFETYRLMPQLSLDALAEASLAVYLSGRNFTALHLVTGVHAMRVLMDVCRMRGWPLDEAQVLRNGWRAWLAAYLSIERPAPAWSAVHAGQASEADWQAQLPALHESSNEHRIKLADAAREEWRHRGWPGYALCVQAAGAAR